MSKGKPLKPKRPARQTTGKNLEARFNAGKEVLDYFDLSAAERPAKAKQKKPARDISADGQLEVRGNKVYCYEPLAGELREYCERHKTTLRQFWKELALESLAKLAALERVANKPNPAKAKKPKGNTRAARG